MITGADVLLFSKNPEADRAFLRDVLGFQAVDAGEGWLIFKLPPAEAALHPSGDDPSQVHSGNSLLRAVLYLMCDDLHSFVSSLKAKNVKCTEITQEPWGIKTTIRLPSGGEIGLYQPAHPAAINIDSL